MMKEYFDFVLNNYNNGFKNAEKRDPNHNVITHVLPTLIKGFLIRNDLFIDGSCGIGQKTDYPWVAVFNRKITTSAKRGLYIVYLFRKDMSGFYLSLNQGITYFKDTYKRSKYKVARSVADYFREAIGDNYFSKADIDLGGQKNTLGYGYQETNIISKFYKKDEFSEKELENDLSKMLMIYDELVGVLAEHNYDYNIAIKNLTFESSDAFETAEEAIDNIKKVIVSSIDTNEPRILRYVEPKAKQTKKYAKMRTGAPIKKLDYISKAQSDMEVGQLGELLAISYEREQLIKAGYPEYAEKVKRVSVVSDAFGYDILSYRIVGTKIEKIYIEVKTTTNKLDVPFYVSLTEKLTSDKLKDNYCIFRIYDAKNSSPAFYKVYGKLEDNFKLDPQTYLATYIGKSKEKTI